MLHQVDAVPALALGEGAIRAVPAEAARLAPGAAVLAVVDPALADGPLASGLVQGLAEAGLRPRLHAPPPGEPKADGIAEAADAARAAGAGLILGFGGGSALDLAKMTAVCACPGEAADPMAYALAARPLARALPKILIPATAGTGAEAASTCVYAAPDGRKTWAWGPAAKPALAVLDPEATATLPAHLTAWCALDAFVHAFEAATNRNAHAGAQTHAHAALRLVAENLEAALDPAPASSPVGAGAAEARQALLLGAFHAGVAIDACSTALAHNLSHALAGLAPVHHGLATALAFERTLPWLAEAPTPALHAAARALGLAGAEAAPAFVSALMDRAGIERRLPEAFAGASPDALAAEALRPENAPMRAASSRDAGEADLRRFAEELLALAP